MSSIYVNTLFQLGKISIASLILIIGLNISNALCFTLNDFEELQDSVPGLVLDQDRSTIIITKSRAQGYIRYFADQNDYTIINKTLTFFYNNNWRLVNIIRGKRSSYILAKDDLYLNIYIFSDYITSIEIFIY